MQYGKLDKELIAQPELWRMALLIAPQNVDVALYPPVDSEEAIFREFTLNPDAASYLKAIEDVIYDNPLLLCDFKATAAFIDTGSSILMPEEVPEHKRLELMQAATINTAPEQEIISSPAGQGITIEMSLDKDLCDFLRRTFFNITIRHQLAPLSIKLASAGNGIRSYAIIRRKTIDLFNYSDSQLLSANTFRYNEPLDAVYYILASRSIAGINPAKHPLFYAGAPEYSNSIIPILRSYISTIAAPELPALPYRHSKQSLNAPHLLTILPLCE